MNSNIVGSFLFDLVLIAFGLLLGVLCFIQKDKRGFIYSSLLVIFGLGLVLIHISRYNGQMEGQIQNGGPVLINRLLSGEPMLIPDEEFPRAVSRLAKKLGYMPDMVKKLGNSTNYTISFHLDGVLAATNALPEPPWNRSSTGP